MITGIDVISDRALADYRDGLKPAQRRIMKAAKDLHAYWNSKTVKAARIVGDTMGKYHPHGDSGIYTSMVTMANAEYPVMHGEGNWGSLTDGPASSRYTEAKISELGMTMLECDDVAEMVPNYTGEYMEPVVIPTRFPYFFVNDCAGIAVGLSVNIPSHNLKEMIESFKMIVKKGRAAKVKDLMKTLKGPDYKYGGKIISTPEEVAAVYEKGEGSIKYECNYTLTREKKNVLLTITGYCPAFSPNSFISKMDSLIDDGDVISVNDCSTKNDPCRLEVLMKSEEVFEKKVHKHIIKSESYRFYAIERTKSEAVEKDVDTKVIVPNMIDLMNGWIDWRKEIETKVCTAEKIDTEEKKWKSELRLLASQNLKIVVKALETEDPIKYLAENLPGLKEDARALEGAKYICDQRVISLQKIDQEKTKNDIAEHAKRIKELEHDISHIDEVVLRELDKFEKFYRDRKLEV